MSSATATSTYIANVVSTSNTWHRVEVASADHRGVKAAARKTAKAQGVEVKFVNDFYIA